MHPALSHLWRRGQRDQKKWNKACDYAINGILIKSGFTLPKGGLWDEAYDGMSAEEIYCILPPDPPQANGQSQPCEGGSGGGQEGDKGQSGGQGLGKGQGLNGDGTLDNHDYWDKSQKKDGKGGEDGKDGKEGKSEGTAKDSNGEGIWHERLARAANQARLRGKMPANLEALVGGTLEPKLPWRDLLANFVQSSTRTNYRTMPPSKKYLHVPLYMPSLTGEFVEFAVAVDTSGSIADEELNQFISEIKNISENFEDYRVHIFACDADVHDIYEIESYDDWPTTYHGRGGTAFIPVFNAIAERGLNISCLLYLTDSYGTFPDVAPDYPVMWVINNPQGTAPWGEIVRLDVNEK
jgi:predicted metal-dependent peptidase